MRRDSPLSLIALLVLSTTVPAEIYRWVDDLGNPVYSQSPPPDSRDVDTVEVAPPPVHPEHPPGGRGREAADVPSPANPALDEATRKTYCETGKRNLELLTDSPGTSLFRTESGEAVRYTAEQIATKIKENQAVVKAYCD